ncbi:hypothetical protein [Allofournierella sp.]|uniref:hypothetical protein n=1 Tax=Allofournierella sp. TaxID=1940256 RepID=UPI003AEF5065
MKKMFSLMLIMISIGVLAVGCTKKESLCWNPQNKSQPVSYAAIDLKEILQLKANDTLFVVDADNEKLLYIVLEEKQQELQNGYVMEQGEVLQCKGGVLNYKTNQIIWEKTDKENIFHSGLLMNQGAILCVSPKEKKSEDGVQDYSIIQYQGSEEKVLAQGTCKEDGYFLPYFNHLKDGTILYSWQNVERSGEIVFGVNQLDRKGNIINLFKRKETKECSFLNSEFDCNGNEFLIFYEENGEGKFYIGDETGEIGAFVLEKQEKLNSFCLLKKYILLGVSDNEDSTNWTHKMILKDYQGQPLAIEESGRDIGYYNITGNGECAALVQNSLGEKFLVVMQQDSKMFELQPIENIEPKKGAAVFFNLSVNEWMVYYPGKNVAQALHFD